MKSLYLPRPCGTCGLATLAAGQPVHTLVIARGHRVQLKTVAGCLWLTCDGALQDCLLPAGHGMAVSGPACLRLGSAYMHAGAEVEWEIHAPQTVWQGLPSAWRRWLEQRRARPCSALP